MVVSIVAEEPAPFMLWALSCPSFTGLQMTLRDGRENSKGHKCGLKIAE